MSDLIRVQGAVISAAPVGEYDKRLVLLTRERGKIAVFAKGARRQNSPFMAAANAFVFGNFTLYEGRNSYNLNQVEITHHFVELAAQQPGIYYGYYFLELADYFGQEGTDEKDMMNLLFLTAKALLNPSLDPRLVRCIYELRTMTIQGMMPNLVTCSVCGRKLSSEDETFFSQELRGAVCSSCRNQVYDAGRMTGTIWYTMAFIVSAPLGKLYTFQVSGEILTELEDIIHTYVSNNTDRKFRSLQILSLMI